MLSPPTVFSLLFIYIGDCRIKGFYITQFYSIAKKIECVSLPSVITPNMEVMKTQSSDARMRTALGSLNCDTKTGLESFKVNGVAYQEFQVEDPGSKGRMLPRVGNDIPSQPAYTSWSGLMRCSPNSRYAARLMEKCGGVAIGVDESEFTEADAKKADAKKAAEEKAAEEKVMSEAEKLEAKKEKARWWRSAHKVIGYWTAPEDWREMLEGNESPALCSTKDYSKQSFQPSWT